MVDREHLDGADLATQLDVCQVGVVGKQDWLGTGAQLIVIQCPGREGCGIADEIDRLNACSGDVQASGSPTVMLAVSLPAPPCKVAVTAAPESA